MPRGRKSTVDADEDDVAHAYADGLIGRREALVRFGAMGIGLASASFLLSACRTSNINVLLIMADDMRYDNLQYMPNVQRLIAAEGRTFTQARCNVPLCQPSRVGLMTGQMSKHNGELGIGFGGTALIDNNNCMAKWVKDAGFRCGLFGKYVNFLDGYGGLDAPAGYDQWREVIGEAGAYAFNVHLNSGTSVITGQYETDYLAEQANAFIPGKPFCCIVTPTQPHAPALPRVDLADKWLDFVCPIVDEVDVSDKPPWIQGLPALTEDDYVTIRTDAIGALQELSAVDDMVDKIISAMDPAVLAKTVVIFTSDNGVHRGEHRRLGPATKGGPYDVGLRVPLLVRGPGFEPGPDISVPVLAMQDITATILDLVNAAAGLPNQAGISLVDICANPGAYSDRILLHEISNGYYGQTGDGISTGPDSSRGFRKLYRFPSVRAHPDGPFTYEAYDLDTDPDELSNWADDPLRLEERDALEADLLALRNA